MDQREVLRQIHALRDTRFRLIRGGEVLALLEVDGRQEYACYPCLEGACTVTPAFAAVKPLFEREMELLELHPEDDAPEWVGVWEELQAPGLFVEAEDGSCCLEILWIHFKGDRAWWWPLYHAPGSRFNV
jgi:hypothetical protein